MVTCVYISVTFIELCPNIRCMYRISTSSLQYFHSEIGISVKQNIEPKEKAVAASADVPAIHPAVIRRRRKVGRSR